MSDPDTKASSTVRRVYMLHTRQYAPSSRVLESLLRESSQLRCLRHPNLLHVFAAVADRPYGKFGLLSELCEAPLCHVLAANVRPFSAAEAATRGSSVDRASAGWGRGGAAG